MNRPDEYERAWLALDRPRLDQSGQTVPTEDPFRIAWEEGAQVAGDGVSIQTKRALKQLDDELSGKPQTESAPQQAAPSYKAGSDAQYITPEKDEENMKKLMQHRGIGRAAARAEQDRVYRERGILVSPAQSR